MLALERRKSEKENRSMFFLIGMSRGNVWTGFPFMDSFPFPTSRIYVKNPNDKPRLRVKPTVSISI